MIGRIISDWHTDGVRFFLNVTIPANSTALVYVPSLAKFPVTGNGRPAESSEGLKFREYRDGYAIYEAVAGNYSFISTWQK
jgi:alpha-L-rhamnosidase